MSQGAPDPVVVALRDLRSRDGKIRAFSADVLGQLFSREERSEAQRQEAEAALLAALQDPEPLVRYNATLSLAEMKATSARTALEEILKDPHPLVRQGAAMALGEMGDLAARPILEEALRDGPPEVRFQAVVSLAHLLEQEALPLIRQAFSDHDGEVRAQAASCLGDLQDTSSIELLAGKLNDPYPDARFEIALALGRMGDTRAVPTLLEFLKHTEHRWAAIGVLGQLKDKSAISPLRKLWRSFFNPMGLKIQAATAVMLLEGPENEESILKEKEFLCKQARRKRSEARGVAIECLGKLEARWALEELASQLGDHRDSFATEIAAALLRAWERGAYREQDALWRGIREALKEVKEKHSDPEARAQAEKTLEVLSGRQEA